MDDDLVLREMVKKALEGKGVLAQLRATLRAAVFTCVDEHERASGVHVPNPTALGVKHDAEGRLALQVVLEFLHHFDLHQSINILKMETDLRDEDMLTREELEKVAATGDGFDGMPFFEKETPILMQLFANLHRTPRHGSTLPPPITAATAETTTTTTTSSRDSARVAAENRGAPPSPASSSSPSPMSLSPPPPPPPPLDPVCGIDGDEDRNVSDDEASPENVQPARVAGDDRMSASVTIRKRRGGDHSLGGHRATSDGGVSFPYHLDDQKQEEEKGEDNAMLFFCDDRLRQQQQHGEQMGPGDERSETTVDGRASSEDDFDANEEPEEEIEQRNDSARRHGGGGGCTIRMGIMDDDLYDYTEPHGAGVSPAYSSPGADVNRRESGQVAAPAGATVTRGKRWGEGRVGGERGNEALNSDSDENGYVDDNDTDEKYEFDYDEPAEAAAAITISSKPRRLELPINSDRSGEGDCGVSAGGSFDDSFSRDDGDGADHSLKHDEDGFGFGMQTGFRRQSHGFGSAGAARGEGRAGEESGHMRLGAEGTSDQCEQSLEGVVNSSRKGLEGLEAGTGKRETEGGGAEQRYKNTAYHDDGCEEHDLGDGDEPHYENDEFDDDDEEDEDGGAGAGRGGDDRGLGNGGDGNNGGGGDGGDGGGNYQRFQDYSTGGRRQVEYEGRMEDIFDEVEGALRPGEEGYGEQDDGETDAEWRRYAATTPVNGNGNNSELEDDVGWQLRVGLSADSSVSVSEAGGSGGNGRLEDMGFEVEDAQRV